MRFYTAAMSATRPPTTPPRSALVRVPATSGNVGSGFDSLGLAFEAGAQPGPVQVSGAGEDREAPENPMLLDALDATAAEDGGHVQPETLTVIQ